MTPEQAEQVISLLTEIAQKTQSIEQDIQLIEQNTQFIIMGFWVLIGVVLGGIIVTVLNKLMDD